jgi:hypothetical protein
MRLGRLDASGSEIAEHSIGPSEQCAFFPNMRGFTVADGGRYRLTMPGQQLPATGLRFRLTNAYRPTDTFLLAVPWAGNVPVAGRVESGTGVDLSTGVAEGVLRILSNTGNSIGDVLADPTGSVIWQDTVNNEVWIKHVGGLTWPMAGGGLQSDANILRQQRVYLTPAP